ncbi:unnamed protein product [Lota lota]
MSVLGLGLAFPWSDPSRPSASPPILLSIAGTSSTQHEDMSRGEGNFTSQSWQGGSSEGAPCPLDSKPRTKLGYWGPVRGP